MINLRDTSISWQKDVKENVTSEQMRTTLQRLEDAFEKFLVCVVCFPRQGLFSHESSMISCSGVWLLW